MVRLRPAIIETGVSEQQAQSWTSHCFRRGSGVDVLEAQGVAAMVRHGDWANARSAEPYASRDEQFASALAHARWAVDASDDDA